VPDLGDRIIVDVSEDRRETARLLTIRDPVGDDRATCSHVGFQTGEVAALFSAP
jgi:hypothetical protein